MPLVRVEVRSEYGLGAPELYTKANKEDPKAVLEGVAVAGLVGILRQLGDLAEFAAEVFHGLQEQVMITSSRSQKLTRRVQRIEAALPRLEKLVLAQRSHVHFAYTSGANWHSRVRCEQSHFIYSDLPRFIMDSYEYCRRPPHLDLLDKFDAGGPGSCLKRYSDPSFFKRASSGSDGAYIDKIIKEKKGRKIKKKRSSLKTGAVLRGASFSNTSSRLQSTSQSIDGQTPPFQTFSNYGAPKSDLGDQSISLGSRYWSGDLEDLSRPSYSMNDEEQTYNGSSFSPARMHHSDSNSFVSVNGKAAVMDEMQSVLSGEQTGPGSFCVTWDGKTEILGLAGSERDHDETFGTISMNFDLVNEERGAINFGTPKKIDHDENLETISTNFCGESERGASHLNTSKEYDYDDTSETHPTNFNIETEERRTSHFKTANDYDQDDNLDTPAGNVGGATEERGIIHFKTAKERDYADTLEIHSIKFDVETEGRASSHLGAAKKCDNDATSEARMINFNIETEESKSSHFRAADGYYQDENFGTLSGNLDGEIEETIVIHFKTAKEHDYADTLETRLMNFGVETEDKESNHLRAAKGHNHDANLEVLSMNSDSKEQGATHFEVAKEYNCADNSETHLTDFDLETENRGTSHLRAAKGYDHDETLETPSMTFDLETQDLDDIHLKTAGKMDVHQDNKEFSMPVPDDILFGGCKSESVGQMNAQLGNEDVPIPTPSDLQGATHFEAAKEYNSADTSETHLTDFDLETENRGTSHLRAAKEYDHDETLETPCMTFDLETQDEDDIHWKTAGKIDIHQDNKEFSMPVPDDILFGGCKSESVGQMNAQLGNEDVSILTPSDLQGATHFEAAKEYNYADTLETHLTDFDLETENGETSHLRAAKDYDHDETLETPSMTFDLETQDEDDIHLKTAGKMDIHQDNKEFSIPVPDDILFGGCKSESVGQMNAQLGNEDVPIPTPSDLQRDDIESETDNYVDALNTIESECETDVDGPNKQEVEQYSDSDNKAVDVGLDMLTRRHSGSHSSNSMSLSNCTTSSSLCDGMVGNDPYLLLPGTCSGDNVSSESILNSVPFESCALENSPPMASKPLSSGIQPINSCEIGDVLSRSNVTSVTSNVSSDSKQQSLGVRVNDKITSSFSEVQKPSPEPSTVTAVKFWTNGGLLGLQPSKPPDFSTLNVSNEVKKSTDDKIGTSRLKSDITERTPRSVDEETVTECSASCQDEKRGGTLVKKASWLFSSADLGVNLQKLSDSCNQRYSDNSQKNGHSETCGTVLPVSPDIASTRGSQEKSSNSSRMFELGNKLLMNGFCRKPSFEKDDNFYAASSPTAVVLDLKNRNQNVDNQTFSGRSKDMLRSVSPLMSPSSSPPLGHMKISFQPIRGFEDHKLQLKFPDGGVSHESGRDMFPTFQLVPEPGVPLHDVGSDSEDDMFCRSSPYGSDCPSHQSDSNSEQWESSESTSSKDHELYDALRRISFSESVPTSGDTGAVVQGEVKKNFISQIPIASSVEHSQSGHLFDLPSLDTLDPSFMERNECDLNSITEAQCYKEPNPSPPPLPPPEWRAMKTQAEWADNRQVIISENLSYAFDCKFGSTISQQPKPAPLKQEQITEGAHSLKSEQPDLQKTSGHKEVDQAVFQKEIEEKDDFLHQIRTKSFNLRRTATSKPTATTVLPTSTQVTAILKKANEIRQAVGSDGEDDTWSDT